MKCYNAGEIEKHLRYNFLRNSLSNSFKIFRQF
jgi:hypothetical protein